MVLVGGLVGVLASAPAQGQSLSGEGPSPGSAALRSLVLPGWGQVANGSWLKGGLFFGAYAGFLSWGISLNQDLQDAKGNPASSESQITLLERDRNQKYAFAALTLLLAMAEAYVDAHLKGLDERINADVGWIPSGSGPVWGLAVTATLGEPAPNHTR